MPVYMGSLTLGNPEIQKHASVLQGQQGGDDDTTKTENGLNASPKPTLPENNKDKTHRRATSTHTPIISEPRIARSANKEWTPSGGAKLSSNLSIVLSNATAGFTKPNVIDLKLGARLWDDDAPLPKRAKLDEVAASSTSGSLGFRVAGMKVFVGDDEVKREVNTEVHDGYKTYDKFYGRKNVDGGSIGEAFEAFLYSCGLPPRSAGGIDEDVEREKRKALLRKKLLVQRMCREISSIEYVLEREESRMYSASVLMVYEGDPDALESVIRYKEEGGKLVDAEAVELEEADDADEEDEDMEDEEEAMKQKLNEVVMIDFAHAKWTPGLGPDENMLKGVRSIKSILDGLLAQVTKQLDS